MHSVLAAVIVGFVTASGSGEGLPFADVTTRVDGRVVRHGRSTVEEQRTLEITFDCGSPDLGPRTRPIQTPAVSCE